MIKAIVFDADDTLWSNEPLFRAAERNCFELLSQYGSREWLNDELYKTEMSNMAELGYGAKAFIISMIETAVRVSGGTVSADTILQIEQAGRAIMRNPAEPLPGVTEALTQIKKLDRYGMAVLTKGELLDQNNKMDRSGLRLFSSSWMWSTRRRRRCIRSFAPAWVSCRRRCLWSEIRSSRISIRC